MRENTSGRLHRPTSWLTVTLLLVFQPAVAQSKVDRALHSVGPDAESVCVLAPVPQDSGVRNIGAAVRSGKSLGTTSTFTVNFVDEDSAEPWPEAARAAVIYATGIWETTIVSSQEIRVNAYWADKGGCAASPVALGSAGPRALHRDNPAFPLPDTWYVDALADALTGLDMGGSYEPDIRVFVNRDCDDPDASTHWYFGTDGNPPAGHVDLVSVVLHELGHGLGVSGAGRVTSGAGTVRYSTRPYAYDRFTVDGSMRSSPLLTYPDFSTELGAALQSGTGGVLYDGLSASSANGGEPPSLYAPESWVGGSSYSHLDEATYNNTSNALMTPLLSTMEANHVVGPVTCGLLEDMGWSVSAANCDVSLPVELADFTALADGDQVVLRWETASERGNLGFEVEHRGGGDEFSAIDFVAGAGNASSRMAYETTVYDLEPGAHQFRLRQMDLDGQSTYSAVVEVEISMMAPFDVTSAFPNPFHGSTGFSLTVGETQIVRVEVFDMLGRSVATLLNDVLVSGERREIRFSAGSQPSGVYVYRVVGERFAATQTAVLIR